MQKRIQLGATITQLRNSKGLTIRELADMSGVSYVNICKIECGKYNASIDILTKILEPLGAEIDVIEKAAK